MAVILGTDHRPIPPSDIVARLKQVDPKLGMHWHPLGECGGTWCIVEHWGDNDPRREAFKKGLGNPAMDFDIIGDAPLGVKSEDAYGYLIKALRNRPQSKSDFHEMLNRVTNYNAEQEKENRKPVMEFAQEMIETNAKTLWREEGKTIPKVYQNESTAKKAKKGK